MVPSGLRLRGWRPEPKPLLRMSCLEKAPKFSNREALGIAERLYNDLFSANVEGEDGIVSSLPSERDQNFRLVGRDGELYVLKISNSMEDRANIEFQNEALRILNERSKLKVAKLINTVEGNCIGLTEGENGAKHMVRLLTYLAGQPLGLCKPKSTHLLFNVGKYFGELDRALADFDHPAAERYLQWDLKHAVTVIRQNKDKIPLPHRRSLIEDILSDFVQNVEPTLQSLRTSIIHNDGNDYNILVEDCLAEPRCAELVTGVIDFGDMLRTYTVRTAVAARTRENSSMWRRRRRRRQVCEPAIVAAYAVLGARDPLAAAAAAAAGYHAGHALEEAELAVLFPLLRMRLCVSVCVSACQQALQVSARALARALVCTRIVQFSSLQLWSRARLRASRPACLRLYGLPVCAPSACVNGSTATARHVGAHPA